MRKAKNLTKIGKIILGLLMVSVLVVGMPKATVLAAENIEVEVLEATVVEDLELDSEISPYTMLTSCIITASGASDGMHIDISTGTVGTASVLGVKDVKIKKKTWYGGWKTVAVSDGGEAYNLSTMGVNILYRNAVKDSKYRITCIHYGNVDEYYEGENDSGEFLFTY